MNKFLNLFRRLVRHELISGSIYIFAGVTLGSFIYFLLNLFLARSLSPVDYGTYAALLSVFTLGLVPSHSLQPAIVRYASVFFAKDEKEEASVFYAKTLKYLFVFALIFIVFFILLSAPLATFLKIPNDITFLLLGVAISISYLFIVNNSFLLALLRFPFIALNSISTAFIRTAFTILFITAGISVVGAFLGLVISSLFMLIFSFYPLRFLMRAKSKRHSVPYREILSYALPSALGILALNSIVSTDVILVKHFFAPNHAGLYGGVSLVGKVIFYFTNTIPGVMFPLVSRRHSKGESFNSLFAIAIFLVLIPSISITLFYFLFPEFSINFFLGGKYISVAPYIGLFGVFITFYSILNVFVNFFLSIKKTVIVFFVITANLFQIILIFLFHEDFYQVIYASILSSLGLIIILSLYYVRNFVTLEKVRAKVAIAVKTIE